MPEVIGEACSLKGESILLGRPDYVQVRGRFGDSRPGCVISEDTLYELGREDGSRMGTAIDCYCQMVSPDFSQLYMYCRTDGRIIFGRIGSITPRS